MKNQADYSKYKCPYSHIEKECGHELHGPEGYENTYGVWCACGFRAPVFCLDPVELKLELKDNPAPSEGVEKPDNIRICPECNKETNIYDLACRNCGRTQWI